jgi:putative transposase
MTKKSQYISTNRSKYYLKYYLILVTKYRRNILVGQLNIEVMESDINHIHFLIRYIPRLSISQLVRRLKQESIRKLLLLHYTTLCQQYWYQHLLWSNGYFVCSIGEASPETIRQYILSRG